MARAVACVSRPATARLAGALLGLPVVLDRAGPFEVLEQDRLDVERYVDVIAADQTAVGEAVLPGDAEVVPVDPGGRREADPPHTALVLLADPEGRVPLAQVGDVERHGAGHGADRELGAAHEGRRAGALGESAPERDLWVFLDVEEVRRTKVRVAFGLAGPDLGRVDLALERRLQAAIEVELQGAVDVLEEASHPGDHHVAGAKLGLAVPGLKDPS